MFVSSFFYQIFSVHAGARSLFIKSDMLIWILLYNYLFKNATFILCMYQNNLKYNTRVITVSEIPKLFHPIHHYLSQICCIFWLAQTLLPVHSQISSHYFSALYRCHFPSNIFIYVHCQSCSNFLPWTLHFFYFICLHSFEILYSCYLAPYSMFHTPITISHQNATVYTWFKHIYQSTDVNFFLIFLPNTHTPVQCHSHSSAPLLSHIFPFITKPL